MAEMDESINQGAYLNKCFLDTVKYRRFLPFRINISKLIFFKNMKKNKERYRELKHLSNLIKSLPSKLIFNQFPDYIRTAVVPDSL